MPSFNMQDKVCLILKLSPTVWPWAVHGHLWHVINQSIDKLSQLRDLYQLVIGCYLLFK